MAIDKFETGKWYLYTGKTRGEYWNSAGLMDFVLDGIPRLCTYGRDHIASFSGQPVVELVGGKKDPAYKWSWYLDLEHWKEVPDPLHLTWEKKPVGLKEFMTDSSLELFSEKLRETSLYFPMDSYVAAKSLSSVNAETLMKGIKELQKAALSLSSVDFCLERVNSLHSKRVEIRKRLLSKD